MDYYIEVGKRKSLSEDMMKDIYGRAMQTLEIYLAKLGLSESFQRIKEQYEEEKEKDIKTTMIKVLYRCRKMEATL